MRMRMGLAPKGEIHVRDEGEAKKRGEGDDEWKESQKAKEKKEKREKATSPAVLPSLLSSHTLLPLIHGFFFTSRLTFNFESTARFLQFPNYVFAKA